jgi:3-isopropylmalate/(R)-2-methylmalate dehydratase small subunit
MCGDWSAAISACLGKIDTDLPTRTCAKKETKGKKPMQPFSTHTGVAAPLLVDDMNTDQIAPALLSRNLKDDYKVMLFNRQRFRQDGSEIGDFVLNKPQFRDAGILVTGHNFGSGSSRESAVWSMLANNIRVIVAKSFADIYRDNCLQNGLLPVVLDAAAADAFIARVVAVDGTAPFTVSLVAQRISGPGGPDVSFEIPAADRTRLLEGLDDIGMTMKHIEEIVSFEKEAAKAQPWLQQAADGRRR